MGIFILLDLHEEVVGKVLLIFNESNFIFILIDCVKLYLNHADFQ
jgi:hypothetical protein